MQISHAVENGIHSLKFPSHLNPDEYDSAFDESYALLGDLKGVRLVLDLSLMDYVNSGFIGIVAEMYSVIEENDGRMAILANAAIDDVFGFVGFKDFVDIVLDRESAVKSVTR